jgi:nicotinamidase-related amidase
MGDVIRLSREHVALAVVDMQEAFRTVISDFAEVAMRIGIAVQGARLLEVPILVTEQYPKGLKRTAMEVNRHLPAETKIIEKLCFSSCGADDFLPRLQSHGVRQVLVCGVEAHICVAQTVLDLLAANYEVFLLVDCITSRSPQSKEVAISRLTAAGAVQSNVEMALFEMMRGADSPQFKAIQNLVR